MYSSKSNNLTNKSRTTAQVERAVRINNNRTKRKVDPYLSCKFNPFDSVKHHNVHIPDGVGQNLLTQDFSAAFDITTTGAAYLRLWPCFPFPVIAKSATNSTITVNGVQLINVDKTYGEPLFDSRLTAGFNGVNNEYTGPAATKGRFITFGWKLIYTGKIADAQGYIQVNPLVAKVDEYQISNTRPVVVYKSDGTQITAAAGTCPLLSLDIGNVGTALNFNTVVSRLEQGAHGILVASGTERSHSFKSVYEYPARPVQEGAANSNFLGLLNDTTAGTSAGVYLYDDHFNGSNIYISTSSSFRLEVFLCIESEIQITSSYMPFAVANTKFDEKALTKADSINSDLPVAQTNDKSLVDPSKLKVNVIDPTTKIIDKAIDKITNDIQTKPPKNTTVATRTNQNPVYKNKNTKPIPLIS